jgi:hypothetical protein
MLASDITTASQGHCVGACATVGTLPHRGPPWECAIIGICPDWISERNSLMKYSSRKGEVFGRLFVLRGFALVKPTRSVAAMTDDVSKQSARERSPASLTIVRGTTNGASTQS